MSIARKLLSYSRILWTWRLLRSARVRYLPEDISIEVTNICNFRCSFCPQSDPNHADIVPRSQLSQEDLRIFMEKIRAAGVRTEVLHWTLDGEPFVHKGFHDLCRIAAEYDFNNHIFSTNGFFLSADRIDQLPRNVRFTLCVDFCDDRAYFEQYRGTAGSWEKVRSHLVNILNNPDYGHVHLSVTDISSFAIKDHAELRRRFEGLKALFPASPRLAVCSRVFHNATGYVKSVFKESTRYNLCPYPWTSFVIACNGDVVACCRDLQHKTVLGNLKRQTLEEIWFGKKFLNLRQALRDKHPDRQHACANCDMPYDDAKFGTGALVRAAVGRLQILS